MCVCVCVCINMHMGFPGSSVVRNLLVNAGATGDLSSIPGSRRFPGEGNGNPLQYSCLEKSMDGGAWWSTIHGAAQSWTQLSDFTFFLKLITYKSPVLLVFFSVIESVPHGL